MDTLDVKKFWAPAAAIAVLCVLLAGAYYMGLVKPAESPFADIKGPPPTFGMLTVNTPTSITVTDKDGKATIFAVVPATQVITQVAAGEAGKALADIPLNTMVSVVPQRQDTHTALSISIFSPPPPPQGVVLVSAMGTVFSKKGDSFVVRAQDSSVVSVVLGTSTKILSNVLAGERGVGKEAIVTEANVLVVGTRRADGGIDAIQVQILVPLNQASASAAPTGR